MYILFSTIKFLNRQLLLFGLNNLIEDHNYTIRIQSHINKNICNDQVLFRDKYFRLYILCTSYQQIEIKFIVILGAKNTLVYSLHNPKYIWSSYLYFCVPCDEVCMRKPKSQTLIDTNVRHDLL